MKIVLLSMNFAPELTGIGKYSGEMAHALVDRGHEVVVVCAVPFYPSWSLDNDYANAYCREQPRPGLTVLRCPIWLPRQLSGLKRALHLLSFAVTSAPVMLALVAWRPRVVMAVIPGLASAPMAWLAARLAGARCWLHVQDLELEAAFGLGMVKSQRILSLLRAAELRVLRGFDIISTISRRMLMRLAMKGVDMHATELLPNWVDLGKIRTDESTAELRRSLGIDAGQLVCLFSGTLNRKQGLGVLIDTARRLAADRPEVMLVICGNGEMRPALERQAAGLANVRFLDLQPAALFGRLLAMADIHLLPQLRGAADLVMPSKLAAMLASGRPVIAAADPGTELSAVLRGLGIVTEPECADGFARAIEGLADDRALRHALGAASRSYAEKHLDAQVLFDRLELQLQRMEATALHRPATQYR